MLTHQIIQSEIEELKQILTHKDLTIPSFWSCIWPGMICMVWFLLSSYLSYGISDFATGLDRIASMVFAGAVGVFSLIATANTRALFLSLPESFRKESLFFGFLAKKCQVYGGIVFVIFSCLAYFSAYNGVNAIVFIVVTGFSLLLTIMVMNIDLGRYQLATLTSVIDSVRNKEVKL
ncbi:hypothetical protein [Klebsiella michiganensis]|uniref:hypothetical protein n=1 Tax=Klebsiella michiganensis TaxID=1134687 RepID=UPI0015E95907|nr:hypothetical protein [Klebsiella michiganensis]QLS23702.1 hypothetical protein HV324_32015 [Klebsiella michiganensis]